MKQISLLITLLLASCQSQLSSGIDTANLDTTADPGTDFYQYATGGWQEAHPLSAEHSIFGSFDVLEEDNKLRLRAILEEDKDKLGRLYASAMDSVRLNEEGLADMQRLLALSTEEMLRKGVRGLFSIYIDADDKDATRNIVTIRQGGLTLGQRDYYLDTDTATSKIRRAYVDYITALAQHTGYSEAEANTMATDVMRIETRLAKASKSLADLRDPEANYHKMTIAALRDTFPTIEWGSYLANLGLDEAKEVIVGQPEALHEVENVLRYETTPALRNLMLWHAMDLAASYVDDESRALSFAFWGKAMSGKQEDKPRWKRAVGIADGAMGEELGRLYVQRHFPPEAKARMEKLISGLQKALAERIDKQEWMSAETKRVAKEKLEAFYVKVGYPRRWTDYGTLVVTDCLLDNVLASNEWEWQDIVRRKLNKPVDRDEWYMTPQTVNAYYNPTTNEICFPAGILQPPFFDMEADDAFNYGAIGVVIGHEMTHGFDDEGSKYDKTGNLRTWWNEDDRRSFEERIGVMRSFFNDIEVLPGLKANGSLTLGENMADHGGLMVAWQAFQRATAFRSLPDIDGYTPAQRFFLAYAGVWAQNIREAELRRRTKSDSHALARWRVNGQLPHIDAWYEAFGIDEDSPMYIPKEQRVTIW